MMTLSPGALDVAQAETYFEEHYSQDDYYTQNQRVVGHWIGSGAAALGLAGEVSRNDFASLLRGINPCSGAVVVPTATHNGRHAAGWDSVFSAPKSVSVQALVGGDDRLIAAHQRAVARSLVEVEAYALSHQKGGRERVVSGNVVGAAFDHLAARPAGNAQFGPDPQLHTHVVLLNLTRRPDGQWRGLDPIEIYRSQTLGSTVYRSELAREVQRLGYWIQVIAGNGVWELEGYSRDQVMAFSQRRQEIERRMAAAGLAGPRAAQIITLETRQAKLDYDESVMRAEWVTRAAAYGIDASGIAMAAHRRGPRNYADEPEALAEALQFSRSHNTEREAVIDRRALEAAALQNTMGRADLDQIRDRAAASTINREITVLKHMLTRAVRWEYLSNNQITGLKPLREPSGRTRFLSLDEIERLLAVCEESLSRYLHSFVVVALNTGMRRNEILGLTRGSVDWANRVATLTDTKNGEARHVYLNDAALDALNVLPSAGDRLFPLGPNQTTMLFRRAVKRAGLEDFRLHDLRHTFASYQAMSGIAGRGLQSLLGHKDPRMTMRYSHLSEAFLRAAVNGVQLGRRLEHRQASTEVGTYLAPTHPKKDD